MKLAGSVNSLLVELASGHRLRGLPSSSGSPSLLHVSRLAPLEGWEAGNVRTSPVPARLTAATWSRSITTRHLPHQSLRLSVLSDWSLSPHLGQVRLEPLVSPLDKQITGSPTHRALYSICR